MRAFASVLSVALVAAAVAHAEPIDEVPRLIAVCTSAFDQGFETADSLLSDGYKKRRSTPKMREYRLRFQSSGGLLTAEIHRSAELSLRDFPGRGEQHCSITIQSEDVTQRFAQIVDTALSGLAFQKDTAGGYLREGRRIQTRMGLHGSSRNPEILLMLVTDR